MTPHPAWDQEASRAEACGRKSQKQLPSVDLSDPIIVIETSGRIRENVA